MLNHNEYLDSCYNAGRNAAVEFDDICRNNFYDNTPIDVREFSKLASMCIAANLKVSIFPHRNGLKLNLYDDTGMFLDDAIICYGSHGYKDGLLETYHLNDCDGYETAQEIFDGWWDTYLDCGDKEGNKQHEM